MAKNPGQVGANATWDGPHQPTNLKEGNNTSNFQIIYQTVVYLV